MFLVFFYLKLRTLIVGSTRIFLIAKKKCGHFIKILGGLGSNTSTGLFGNQNQAKPGGLFGGTNTLFSGTSTFPQNSFGLQQPAQQQNSYVM